MVIEMKGNQKKNLATFTLPLFLSPALFSFVLSFLFLSPEKMNGKRNITLNTTRRKSRWNRFAITVRERERGKRKGERKSET